MADTDPELVLGDEAPINDSPNSGVDPEPEPAAVPVETVTDDTSIFKVWEKRAEDEVALLMADGRVFIAKVKAEIEGLRKGSAVTVSHDGLNADGVPTNAVVDGKAADAS